MLTPRVRTIALLLLAIPAARAADPADNPVATFYSGPEGYPAWTDGIHWSRVINMKTYPKGKTAFEKFEKARDELGEGGGVLYYPAGTYDFTTMPPGRGLMLNPGAVIRGDAPTGHPVAADGKLELPTKFVFPFRPRGDDGARGQVPGDWNFIGIQRDEKKNIKNVGMIGIAWVHLVGATIAFGPQMEWGKSWATAESLLSNKIKKAWGGREADGTHPMDPLAGGRNKYVGAGNGRLVFGCVLDDAAVLDDFTDPGYGPNGFQPSRYCARITVYGSRVLVANNVIPRAHKNFRYHQATRGAGQKKPSLVQFDYGRTIGIDVNKELLAVAAENGTCPGYFEEGVVVRDNYVFNHGHKGFNISGKWVTVTGNHNERAFLRQGDDVLTLDGWELVGKDSDTQSRAFDLAGRNVWIDGNRFNNTGASPGNDGEGIIGRAAGGTQVYSWAITHNVHTRGTGLPGGLGGLDTDCHGLLIAWNQTAGWVGNQVKRKPVKMTDCAFVGNKCESILPDAKTIARLEFRAPLTAAAPAGLTPPTKVTATEYLGDAVQITWEAAPDSAVAFRVERRIADGNWHVIAYRPPRLQGDPENPQEWVDFTAPAGKVLTYRVVALAGDDTEKGASKPTGVIRLPRPH
jgi:hypothetical protein